MFQRTKINDITSLFSLYISAPSGFISKGRNKKVLTLGTHVKFKRKVTPESKLRSVNLFKVKQHIYSTSFKKDNTLHILTFNKIKESDIGEYKCEVRNAKGNSISERMRVVYGR